eukprot:Gb_15622 [translate_table: standard]
MHCFLSCTFSSPSSRILPILKDIKFQLLINVYLSFILLIFCGWDRTVSPICMRRIIEDNLPRQWCKFL